MNSAASKSDTYSSGGSSGNGSGWVDITLKRTLFEPMKYGANEAAADADRASPRFIRITDMKSDGELRSDTFRSLPYETAKEYLLQDKDILVARTGATVGKSFFYRAHMGVCCFAGYLIRIRVDGSRCYPNYVNWCLHGYEYWDYINSSQIQATLQNVNAEKYADFEIAMPVSYELQKKIAQFLDHEAAKIDTLIEKQKKLIALLKEKRQAVISHAVTKGLNPDAPMKDSGVEWLGEIPEGWAVVQIRNILQFMEQGSSPDCENRPAELGEWGVLKTSCVNWAVYREQENKALPLGTKPRSEYEVQVGDLLMSRASGSKDLIGSVAIVENTAGQILLSDKVFRLQTSSITTNLFLYNVMRSNYVRKLIESNISGGEGMANNITKTSVIGYKIVLPPLDEQALIVEHIVATSLKLTQSIERTTNLLELLAEKKSALISATVTGKIDVTNWHPPKPQKETTQ